MANDMLDQEFKIKVQLLLLKRGTSAMGLVQYFSLIHDLQTTPSC